jgi:hypothetical protein
MILVYELAIASHRLAAITATLQGLAVEVLPGAGRRKVGERGFMRPNRALTARIAAMVGRSGWPESGP